MTKPKLTNRQLLAKVMDAQLHWTAAAEHRAAAWHAGKLIGPVWDQLSPKETKTMKARWLKIVQRKTRRQFIIPDIFALTVKALAAKLIGAKQ
jgi:hypothetical protein